jgi:NTE family protein
MTEQMKASRETVLIDLALQGGGSHGAFTWGVLDRLLEEPWLKIDAISGTSAGAMNAALVSGFIQDGAQGARAHSISSPYSATFSLRANSTG